MLGIPTRDYGFTYCYVKFLSDCLLNTEMTIEKFVMKEYVMWSFEWTATLNALMTVPTLLE